MKNLAATLVTILLLLGSVSSIAADSIVVTTESKSETQSIRCSAIYFVLTNVNQPELNAYYTAASKGFSEIYALERKKRTLAVTYKDIFSRRDVTLSELSTTYKNNPDALMDEVAICATWMSSLNDPKANLKVAPTKQQLAKVKEDYKNVVRATFSEWVAGGSQTPEDVKNQIRESLSK